MSFPALAPGRHDARGPVSIIPSIIATLATQFLWRGAAVVAAGGLSYSLRGVKDASVWQVTSGRLLDWFPMQAVWTLAIGIIGTACSTL